jgi:pyridoxamine 5'-phosphate oxidase
MTEHENPFKLFTDWYTEYQKLGVKEPTHMILATATKSGKPSCRIVLLKGHDENGFVFYTNSQSRKGGELTENPQVAATFYWMDLQKQVRIEGVVEPIIGKEADDYYHSRSLKSRIGAWASLQSQILPSRAELLKRAAEFGLKFGLNPPRPEHWHGYRIIPSRIEFWQEGDFRLHDRTVYTNTEKGWEVTKLYP